MATSATIRQPSASRDRHGPTIDRRWIERFVKSEYWRLARLHDGRFAYTRAPLTRRRSDPAA